MLGVSNQGRQSFILLCSCLFLGVLFDFLFYGKVVGISYPIFWVVLYGLFYWTFRKELKVEKRFEWFLMIPILLLTLTFLLFSNQVFFALNSIVVPILFIVQTMLLTKNNKNPWYKVSFVGELLAKVFVESIANVTVPFKLVGQWLKTNSNKTAYGVVGKVLIGLFISLPLLGIIMALLTSADSIFSHWVSEIPNWLGQIELGDLPGRTFLVLLVFFALFTYLWSLLHPYQEEEVSLVEHTQDPVRIDGIISLTILFVIDLVYVLFTVIQVSYLLGEAKSLLPEGVTYSEYAREGFWQLVTVTIINIIILITFIHLVQKAQPVIYRLVQILLSVLTICTGFMLFSGFFRLSLYEEAYGYTYLRLFVHAFMILLLVLFIIGMIKIWSNKVSLMKYYAVTILVWYVILNYINIDEIIAEKNVERYQQIKQIDLVYLKDLSYDVIPALMKLRENKDKGLKREVDYWLSGMKDVLAQEKDWQSFNFSKHKARQLLKNMK